MTGFRTIAKNGIVFGLATIHSESRSPRTVQAAVGWMRDDLKEVATDFEGGSVLALNQPLAFE